MYLNYINMYRFTFKRLFGSIVLYKTKNCRFQIIRKLFEFDSFDVPAYHYFHTISKIPKEILC